MINNLLTGYPILGLYAVTSGYNLRPSVAPVISKPRRKNGTFYAELKQSQQNIYSGELGLLQFPDNALLSLVQKQNVSVGRPSRVFPGGWLSQLALIPKGISAITWFLILSYTKYAIQYLINEAKEKTTQFENSVQKTIRPCYIDI